MKYFIDYQYKPKGAIRPIDDGAIIPIEATDQNGLVILPNVGDYVHVDTSGAKEAKTKGHRFFSGKVSSRLFRYHTVGEETYCSVNIVVAATDDDWGQLIKE